MYGALYVVVYVPYGICEARPDTGHRAHIQARDTVRRAQAQREWAECRRGS